MSGCGGLCRWLVNLLTDGKRKLVLNMNDVTQIDSAGVGALVAVHHSANSAGASLRLCRLGSKFKETLQITRLLTVFEVSDSEADAVRSLS